MSERPRHSKYFGIQLASEILNGKSRFPNRETAEAYFKQMRETFSCGENVGGKGYVGEIFCHLQGLFPDSYATLVEMCECQSIEDLSKLLLGK